MVEIVEKMRNGIVVSCQAEGRDPFNADPEYMALFAKSAELGGAKGIRTEGIEKLLAIKKSVMLPIIGLLKSSFPDGTVKITGSFAEVEALLFAGSDIVAIDGTFRQREGVSGPQFIEQVKKQYGCVVLADIATTEEAEACEKSGADCVSTTLNGYTPETMGDVLRGPNLVLLKEIVSKLKIPVFAEGRYNTPIDAKRAVECGAFAVVSGTAITRPKEITRWFDEAIKSVNVNR